MSTTTWLSDDPDPGAAVAETGRKQAGCPRDRAVSFGVWSRALRERLGGGVPLHDCDLWVFYDANLTVSELLRSSLALPGVFGMPSGGRAGGVRRAALEA